MAAFWKSENGFLPKQSVQPVIVWADPRLLQPHMTSECGTGKPGKELGRYGPAKLTTKKAGSSSDEYEDGWDAAPAKF